MCARTYKENSGNPVTVAQQMLYKMQPLTSWSRQAIGSPLNVAVDFFFVLAVFLWPAKPQSAETRIKED